MHAKLHDSPKRRATPKNQILGVSDGTADVVDIVYVNTVT
jgi:hypothetical protein